MVSKCYAEYLGDCEGNIEFEHFIPKSLQNMFGAVDVSGLAWQEGDTKKMQPGSYANARVICKRHHDQLDGLDGVALDYFRNFMLLAGQRQIRTGEMGRIQDIKSVLNGRALEKWFMKTICGAIAAKAIDGVNKVPQQWTDGLFAKIPWPEDWAIHVSMGDWIVKPEDARFKIEFHWASDHSLNGLVIKAFSVETTFSIVPLDLDENNAHIMRRPDILVAGIERPNGGEVLDGLRAGQPIILKLKWE
ncbi:hypothetical protein ACFLVW_02930 [Chloroflexota bacterium]